MAWSKPVSPECWQPTQRWLVPDKFYKNTGVHPGTDYPWSRITGIQNTLLFSVSDGEIVYSGLDGKGLGTWLGNFFSLYVKSVDRSFLYCHLRSIPPAKSTPKCGEIVGVMGNTGVSTKGVHLHLEGWYGRFNTDEQHYSLKKRTDVSRLTFDAHSYISNICSVPVVGPASDKRYYA